MTAMLEIAALQMRFQGLTALDQVSFSMEKGSITSLIGPNGAGKTTLFNCVTGMYTPTGGRVAFEGEDITGQAAHRVSRHGIARTFQNLALFAGLSVMDNLLVGAYRQGSSGLLQGAFLTPRARAEQRAAVAAATEVLEFLGMPETAGLLPGEMPYGKQKQVEFARALMQKARANGGNEHDRKGGDDGADPARARGIWHELPDRRARHTGDHGHFGQDRRAGLRAQDCRRNAA